jgi:hypothetical protein
VVGVRREELGWERVYRLAPIANPGTLAHALIVKAGSGQGAGSSGPEAPR